MRHLLEEVSDEFAIKIASENTLKMKDCPPQRPDFNPVEQIWDAFSKTPVVKCQQISFLNKLQAAEVRRGRVAEHGPSFPDTWS